jgi:1,2-diacylglycerol 3-alpha-glucosyltransferase
MNKPLKIAFFLDNFYPQVNGVVTSSINTANELARRGNDVLAVVPRPGKEEMAKYPKDYFDHPTYFQKGFPAYFYPDFNFTYTFSAKLHKAVKDFGPDIIHFHAPFTIGYQAIRTARKLNVPVVGTFHTFFAEPEYLSLIGMQDSKFLINFGWWYSNQYFNRCDAVVSPGKDTARFLKTKDLKSPVHLISNGVETAKYSKFKFNADKFPVKPGKNEEWILFIGRISKEKCLDVLLDAVEIVMAKRKNVRLLVVGDGPYRPTMEALAAKKNIKDKIFFTGMIPNKDLLESGILNKMKLFATPSTSENQPMTIIESIMFDLPIVGVDARGVPELIEGNGFIVKPGDPKEMAAKMLKILSSKLLYWKFSGRSKELKKKYDIRNTTDSMEGLYRELLRNY